MKTLIATAAFGVFLFWLYSHSHAEAILAGMIGIVLILAEGNWHFARVRRDATR